jgi:hypothetical protein
MSAHQSDRSVDRGARQRRKTGHGPRAVDKRAARIDQRAVLSTLSVSKIELVVDARARRRQLFDWPHFVEPLDDLSPYFDPAMHVLAARSPDVDAGAPSVLSLDSRISPIEIGSVFAELAQYSLHFEEDEFPSVRAVVAYFAAHEQLVVGGGVRVWSERGVEVFPGCCSGCESFGDWLSPHDASWSPWCGHDPTTRLAVTDAHVKVSTDDVDTALLDRASFERPLDACARETQAFVPRFHQWISERCTPEEATCFTERLRDEWALNYCRDGGS